MPRHIGPGETADHLKHIERKLAALSRHSNVSSELIRLLERHAAEVNNTASKINAYERRIRHAHPDHQPTHRS